MLRLEEIEGLLRVADQLSPADRKKILMLLEHDRVQRCRDDFLAYVGQVWPIFISGRHHKIMADAFERVAKGELKRLIINMPPRHRLKIDTPIPTTKGWKTVESVEVGDCVFAPDGSPVLVTGKSDVYEERLYEVETSDGQVIECDGEHLWTVRFGSGRPFQTMSTREILEKLERESWRKDGNYPMLPSQAAAQFPRRKLLIDPYVLGVWLGDGSSRSSSVGCSFGDMEKTRLQIEECGYQTTFNPKFQQFYILGLNEQLRQLGLLKNKRIPEEYLCSSVEQRKALLQGLIDTDGDVTKEGKVTFNQTDEAFASQVLCLVHSLGVKARITYRQTSYKGKPSKRSCRIMFKMAGAARLPRKAVRCREMKGNWSRSIDVRKTERVGLVRCLEVANADGLFMAGRGWVVTHNTKSEFASYLLPSWFLGKFPEKKIIQAAHTAELAMGFGRKVRNLVSSEPYQKIFETKLSTDSKAANRWNTNKGGDYFAVGVNGAVTGKGADLLIIDDPHSEQEAKLGNPAVYDQVYEWFTSGPRQRLQPGGAVIIVMTRWATRDLAGQIIKNSSRDGADNWEVIEFPAILPSGNPLWPGFWKIEELEAIKAEIPVSKWEAQYQQNPTSEEGAIVKREYWKIWEESDPPDCEYVIQSWDTAFEKHNRADYSACTTWGVFRHPDKNGELKPNIILLDAFKDRMEFPELKKKAFDMWKEWNPDTLLVEKRAAGAPLIYELRKMGIPLSEYTPHKGQDKIARVNSIADLFASGVVWRPETRWAEEVMEEMASFPNADHDDLTDSSSQALMRFRQGGFISVESDEPDEPIYRRTSVYY
jgi:predicted phage terminase large subunit-like protein